MFPFGPVRMAPYDEPVELDFRSAMVPATGFEGQTMILIAVFAAVWSTGSANPPLAVVSKMLESVPCSM